MVLLLSFLQSNKITRLYLLTFQSSAARSQPHDRKLCNVSASSFQRGRKGCSFWRIHEKFTKKSKMSALAAARVFVCENRAQAALNKASGEFHKAVKFSL